MICTHCYQEKPGKSRRGMCKTCWTSNRGRDGWSSRYVDARPVREHVLMLQAANLGTRRISELSGVNRKTVQWIISGRTERGTGPSRRVLQANAEKLLAVPVPKERHELAANSAPILATGSVRRLQALVAMGYTQHYLSERMGVDESRSVDLFHHRRQCVSARRARIVACLYDELSVTPTDNSPWARRSRERARRLGWADPFAWEDKDMDDPDEQSESVEPDRPLSRRERYDELVELGFLRHEIARRLGLEEASLLKWMNAQDIHVEALGAGIA